MCVYVHTNVGALESLRHCDDPPGAVVDDGVGEHMWVLCKHTICSSCCLANRYPHYRALRDPSGILKQKQEPSPGTQAADSHLILNITGSRILVLARTKTSRITLFLFGSLGRWLIGCRSLRWERNREKVGRGFDTKA